MKKSILIAAAIIFTASSVAGQGPAGITQMVNEEFGLIAQELELEPLQVHHLGKILEKKAGEVIPLQNQIISLKERRDYMEDSDPKMSAYIENEISNIRARIKQINADADESLTEHLSDEQTAKYFEEVKPAIEEKRKASTARADAAKK